MQRIHLYVILTVVLISCLPFASGLEVTSIPLIGPIFYVGLTVMYAMGIINQVGSPESV